MSNPDRGGRKNAPDYISSRRRSMTAAFVALFALFLPLSALPGQDACSSDPGRVCPWSFFGVRWCSSIPKTTLRDCSGTRFTLICAREESGCSTGANRRPASSLIAQQSNSIGSRASRNCRTTGADSAEVSGTYLKVVLRPLLDIARSTFDFFSPKECLSSPK